MTIIEFWNNYLVDALIDASLVSLIVLITYAILTAKEKEEE